MQNVAGDANRTVACRSCAASAGLLVSSCDFNRRVSTERFDYYRCSACDLVFLEPVPLDLGRYYEESYHMIPDSLAALERSAEAHERFKIDLLRSVKASGRLIEVGPGAGGFAWLARKSGYDVTVIDMSERVCRFISGTVGVHAVHSQDEVHALEEQEPADAIVMWQVIEHLKHPFRMLAAAAGKLKPQGVLIVATPNPRSLQFRVLGRWWVHLDAPRHVTLIPAPLLETKARSFGLTPLWRTATDPGSLFWNEFGWRYSLRNALARTRPPATLDRVARWAATLAGPLERRFRLGTSYTAAFVAP
jgi:hypothetical protein